MQAIASDLGIGVYEQPGPCQFAVGRWHTWSGHELVLLHTPSEQVPKTLPSKQTVPSFAAVGAYWQTPPKTELAVWQVWGGQASHVPAEVQAPAIVVPVAVVAEQEVPGATDAYVQPAVVSKRLVIQSCAEQLVTQVPGATHKPCPAAHNPAANSYRH